MPITRTTPFYAYDELSETAQESARVWLAGRLTAGDVEAVQTVIRSALAFRGFSGVRGVSVSGGKVTWYGMFLYLDQPYDVRPTPGGRMWADSVEPSKTCADSDAGAALAVQRHAAELVPIVAQALEARRSERDLAARLRDYGYAFDAEGEYLEDAPGEV